MKVVESEVASAGYYAAAAAADARMRNAIGITHFSDMQVARANRMKYVLELCYKSAGIYINYRRKFITVKVSDPVVSNRKMLDALTRDWETEGIYKVATQQGILFRIPQK